MLEFKGTLFEIYIFHQKEGSSFLSKGVTNSPVGMLPSLTAGRPGGTFWIERYLNIET